jgi:hypothetical protein
MRRNLLRCNMVENESSAPAQVPLDPNPRASFHTVLDSLLKVHWVELNCAISRTTHIYHSFMFNHFRVSHAKPTNSKSKGPRKNC